MSGFFSAIYNMLNKIEFSSVYEAGCGEGHVIEFVLSKYKPDRAGVSDLSEKKIKEAAEMLGKNVETEVASIYEIPLEDNSYELVIASEVLEHLDDPSRALRELERISSRYVLVSVPREPIWRVLNFCRGKYMKSFGNTPGHIQHWSISSFKKFLRENSKMNIFLTLLPFPWIMVLMEKTDEKK